MLPLPRERSRASAGPVGTAVETLFIHPSLFATAKAIESELRADGREDVGVTVAVDVGPD